MTREEAVKHVWELADSVASEFCADDAEIALEHAKAREALRTLGVTDTELAEWYP